jgi:predicted nucleotidyltransferase
MDEQLEQGLTTILQSAALPIRCAYVFGSVAKNTAKPNSDIDLAVLCEKLDAQEKLRLLQAVADLTERTVDWVDLKSAGTVVALEALKGKRLIGTDEQHAQLLTRTLIDAGDFGLLYERILSERREAWFNE